MSFNLLITPNHKADIWMLGVWRERNFWTIKLIIISGFCVSFASSYLIRFYMLFLENCFYFILFWFYFLFLPFSIRTCTLHCTLVSKLLVLTARIRFLISPFSWSWYIKTFILVAFGPTCIIGTALCQALCNTDLNIFGFCHVTSSLMATCIQWKSP